MFLALKSSQVRLSDVDAFANRAILPRISTLPGIAQVLIFGTQKYAVRVRANLDQLAVRGLTLQELQTAIVNANSSKPIGAIADQRQSSILDATGPINKAADYMPVIVTWQNGAPVRISDVATAIDGVENDKVASWLDGTRAILLAVYRQPDANTVEVVDRVKAMLPAIQAELPSGVDIVVLADRSVSIRHAIEDVEFTLLPGRRAGRHRHLLLPAQLPRDAHSRPSRCRSRSSARSPACMSAATRSTTSRCWR